MTSKACPLRYEELLQPLVTGTPAATEATPTTGATAVTAATGTPPPPPPAVPAVVLRIDQKDGKKATLMREGPTNARL